MPAFGNIGFHPGKYLEPAKDKGVAAAVAGGGNIAVDFVKLLGVEVLGQTDGVQPRAVRFASSHWV